ncbi:hypothetical protein A2276_06640 [candidate division WOR-1 bacterium RIFOXYA12_FULL_43_27]|uniref:Cell division protein SepF n=1 Tax=candidate division WOR-1 bacterium RIFOXYC2_FULL_46_14 TaxID=1802587 RepID=A0A1F4U5L8_UNCSA|nr:MAG: hypothetical protein A2276_06640 [candidate division WOR-1 bacterium RIFOXYA12_FULL_43_27]OGC20323.1 MAG: hypothetical protein A2292_04640 [candidate division WOR-1 bacterium RIFOXYB2_FULL_46_45]OGC31940.1 MAG: hypothetical protein A2232_06810 [candidate division WOR-1 bacterium RIFOXYA2_FULL_46_56]OGC40169.1 MAG: hypothetical protein A2438_02660 [candidate division WOR-1 bacterium RIFOXYC2_FULL_46_14]
MVENLLKRAKVFMGLETEEEENRASASQLDIGSILKGRREAVKEKTECLCEIMLYEPKVYEDSLSISGSLRGGSPVLVNLKNLDPSEGTRLIDFVCGTAYAIDGHMVKIAETIFLFTPNSVRVTEAEEKGILEEGVSPFGERKDSFFGR